MLLKFKIYKKLRTNNKYIFIYLSKSSVNLHDYYLLTKISHFLDHVPIHTQKHSKKEV